MKRKRHPRPFIGSKYGDWKVVGGPVRENGYTYWQCRCVCGAVSIVIHANLTSGRSRGCVECAKEKATKTRRAMFGTDALWARFDARVVDEDTLNIACQRCGERFEVMRLRMSQLKGVCRHCQNIAAREASRRLRLYSLSFQEMGDLMLVSKQRAHQIVSSDGLSEVERRIRERTGRRVKITEIRRFARRPRKVP